MNPSRALRPAVAALLCIAGGAHAATYTVGSDFACTHATVQAAVTAAANAVGDDVIRIARNQSYTAQAIVVPMGSSGSMTAIELAGGFDDCGDSSPSGATLLSGLGGDETPVLTLRGGRNVVLRNLSLIRGDASMTDGRGGGIRFDGSGQVELHGVVVSQNRAAFGGGIDFQASSLGASLRLGAGTQIVGNTAQVSGGGIRISGAATVTADGIDSFVINNEALGVDAGTGVPTGGFGGGVLVEAPALASLRFDGDTNAGGVSNNQARYGGGLAVRNLRGGGSNAAVRVAAPDTLRIAGNSAVVAGGGVWVDGASTDGSGSDIELCLSNVLLQGNSAPAGAAIHAGAVGTSAGGDPSRARLYINRNCTLALPGSLPPASPPCALAGSCNRIAAHTGNPASLVRLGPGASLDAQRIAFAANQVQRLVDAEAAGVVAVNTCLATGNTLGASLLRVRAPQGQATLAECTLADNTIGGTYQLEFPDGGALALRNSILWHPGKLLVSPAGGGAGLGAQVIATLSNDRTTLPDAVGFIDGPPAFNDPSMADYRPRPASPAVDAAAPAGGADLVFKPRDQRILPAASTTRDIGAYERQPTDPMLVNGAFAGGFSQWTVRGAPWVSYDTANNDGADGTGAATLAVPFESGQGIAQIEVVAQCFAVPFVGTYRLGARATAPGTLQTRDVPKLAWRLRMDSPTCSGASTAGGETFFPGSGSGWASATPADVVVPAAGFGPGTTLEIIAIVAQNPNGAGALSARFDNFSVLAVSGAPLADPVFGDGFETP